MAQMKTAILKYGLSRMLAVYEKHKEQQAKNKKQTNHIGYALK